MRTTNALLRHPSDLRQHHFGIGWKFQYLTLMAWESRANQTTVKVLIPRRIEKDPTIGKAPIMDGDYLNLLRLALALNMFTSEVRR